MALASILVLHAATFAADPVVESIRIETGRTKDGVFLLSGRDAWQQILVLGKAKGGQSHDLTRAAKYTLTPPDIAAIDETGLVTPLKEGVATIEAKASGKSTKIQVNVTNLVKDVPINFTNQVVPLFTKFGCNGGGCHGKSGGQNHFALSLLGFEPEEDYEYLVKETRGGRRIFPAAPEHSMLLRKAAGTMAHGGGKKFESDSPYFHLMRRWIEQGMPFGQKDDPSVTRIQVLPSDATLQFGEEQQLTAIAHLSDGSSFDITRMTQFEVNDKDLASVSENGLVKAKRRAGTVAVMVRYQTFVDVFRAVVPLGQTIATLPKSNNFIDDLVFKKLKQLGLPPSPVADDATFLRRATIDIAGRMPTLKETQEYLEDKDAKKQDKLIDRLLASQEHSYYFAGKWSAVLRNRRKSEKDDTAPTFAFYHWIQANLEQNKPFDQIVRDVLTATGKYTDTPQAVWYREVRDVSSQVEDVAQLLLGQRIACARCHHHPFEKWSQQDYYGMAAFFTRVEFKDPPAPKKEKDQKVAPPKPPFEVNHKVGVAQATNPRTKKAVQPTALGADPLKLAPEIDPRVKLVEWMTSPENPYFARTLANRYWKHFMGRGLVEPEDDLRVTNPPTNPELLDALADSFVKSKYNLRELVRTICSSQVYRLSAIPNEFNAEDRQNYSRFQPRRLNAEVLFDAVEDVTMSKSNFKGVPAGTRAVQLPDNQFDSYFLSVFGRPDSASACECERSGDASLAQSLHLLNSVEVQTKISKGRAAALAKDQRKHDEKLKELYLITYSRQPTADEMSVLTQFIERSPNNVIGAYEDIIWSLLNTKEFMFNH